MGTTDASGFEQRQLEPGTVTSQFRRAIRYFGCTAVKIGYLGTPETAEAIAAELSELPEGTPIIVDPSLINRHGHWVAKRDTAKLLRDTLLPGATIITPNVAEAELLTGRTLETATDMEDAGKHVMELGANAALITGGHRNGAYSDDLLAWRKQDGTGIQVTWLRAARVGIDRIEGAGCTLTSGIAAGIARGQMLPEATESAKIYLTAALRAGSRWHNEQGSGPLHHFYAWWNQKEQTS